MQIAKTYGTEVTGVDSASNLDMLRSIGADHAIDYTREDFTRSGQRYDLILATVSHRSIFDNKRAVSPNGTFVMVGSSLGVILQTFLLGPLISINGSKKMGIVPWKPNDQADLAILAELFETGKVAPVIDKVYPLSEIPQALQYLEAGHAKGKVVITSCLKVSYRQEVQPRDKIHFQCDDSAAHVDVAAAARTLFPYRCRNQSVDQTH
ncbi:MAG: NAD(P)-dependent alcohol dehydrogenase [Anaerolineales bacterium]|nr:NAD(P)-dependent alcohol dehydrogenase [Anaerolineales bacterium]